TESEKTHTESVADASHEQHLHRIRKHGDENDATTIKKEGEEDKGDAEIKTKAEDTTTTTTESSPHLKGSADSAKEASKPMADVKPKEKVLHVVVPKSKNDENKPLVVELEADLNNKTDAKDGGKAEELPHHDHDEEEDGEIGESAAKSDDEEEEEEENPEDYYFYAFDKNSPVIELPRYEGDPDLAPFITEPNPGEIRIVEFYAHWCPHCYKFRTKFNKFAKRMMEIAEQSGLNLKVYAISCVPHKTICRSQGVKNYPRVKVYKAGSQEPIAIDKTKVHPFEILKKLGAEAMAISDVEEEDWNKEEDEDEETHQHADSAAALLGAGESFWIPRTKKEIYHDAFLSFDFTMRNNIFTSKDPLSEDAKEALSDFISILAEVLPPTWRLQWLVSELADNIEDALESEEKLLAIVDKHPPKKKKWSKSCSRGQGHMGYTCGLWQLFHIMTMGVVQWNQDNVAGKKQSFYSMDEAAETLRYFIEHFFGCEVCRINFIHEYDSCSFNRCERLLDYAGTFDDWKEFPLWLFEFHNGVNTRLLKERAEAQGTISSAEELSAVEWPARNHCPACWYDDGRFDPDRVYMFLELIYWPDELISKRKMAELVAFTSHKQRLTSGEGDDPIPEPEGFESWVYSLAGLVVASTVLSAASWAHKRKEIQRTGKHKKEDDDKC
ncbi:MAG: hypothetical protein SGILL_005692, partial [Bacillariaceae sp.]